MSASLCGVPKYSMLKVKEMDTNQEVMVLIDPGATNSFIDEEFMRNKGFKTKEFEGFHFININGKLKLVDNIVEKFGIRFQDYVAR